MQMFSLLSNDSTEAREFANLIGTTDAHRFSGKHPVCSGKVISSSVR